MAFLFSGGRKDEGDISKLRRSVDKLMKEGNIKQVIDNIESTVLEAGSTKKVEDIKWALRTTELIVNHIFQTAGKINFDLANDDSQTELIRLIWDLPTLKGAWDLYHQGLKGGSLIDAGIMGQFGARMEEKGAQRPDIKERLEVSGEALDTIAKCAVSIGEISIKSESSFFTTEMMFGIAMDCWKRLNNPNKFAETETRFAQVERFLADVLERDGQPYTAERARKIANKEEELAKLILSRGIIETREEHNEKVYGKLVEIVPMGAWLAAERVAEYMDIDRNGHYDLRATQLFSPEWGTSTVNIWVSQDDKPNDWPASAEKPGPMHKHAFLVTVTAVRLPGSDDLEVRMKMHNSTRKEIAELMALKGDRNDFSTDKSFKRSDMINAAENGTKGDWEWATRKLHGLILAGKETMVEGDLHGLKCPACKHDVQEFSTTKGLEDHFHNKHGVETYGTATISGKIFVFTEIGTVLVYDGVGR